MAVCGALLLAALVVAACAVALLNGGSAASARRVARLARRRPPRDDPDARRTASRTSSPSTSPGLGYGYGYVAAKDNICVLADTYVTVNAERSRWFGPDATYTQGGNGATQTNLNSDFFYQRIKDKGAIEDLLALEPPRGPRPEIKEGVRGYVAGYNRYLRDTGVDNITDPRCRRRAVGAPDHRDGRLPALLPARPARQPGRRDRRHRRRAAAGRRRPDAAHQRRAGAR